MDVFAEVRDLVRTALGRLVAAGRLPQGLDLGPVTVEPPRDPAHGDMATNAAMVLARPAGQAPRALAEALAAEIGQDARILSAEVAGPGFLNLRLDPALWRAVIPAALAAGAISGARRSGPVGGSTSSSSPRTPPARCMSATPAARCSATRSPGSSISRASR
jgi:arginyl-tRNA synthetase